MDVKRQVPIWFFVGGTLLIYGLIIAGVGLHSLIGPAPDTHVAMSWLHADIWWGGLMTIVGLLYVVRYWP